MLECLFILAVIYAIGAAYSDVQTRKIPNKYQLLGLILALTIRTGFAIWKQDFIWVSDALWGMLIGFSLLFTFFVIKHLFKTSGFGAGAGDVKLLAVMGAFLGWKVFLLTFVFTAIVDACLLVYNYGKLIFYILALPGTPQYKIENISLLMEGRRPVKNPYALPVAIGTIVCFLIYFFRPEALLWTLEISKLV